MHVTNIVLLLRTSIEAKYQLLITILWDPYPVQYRCAIPLIPAAHLIQRSLILTPHQSKLAIRVLCCSHFSFPILNFKTPFASLTSTDFLSHTPGAPLSQHPCSLPLPQPRRHRFPHTRLRPIKKNKEKTASEIATPKHAPPPLSQHPRSLPLPQPRRHRFPYTRLRPIKKNKEKTAPEIAIPKHAHPF